MGASMNAFRIIGDVSHMASKCILIGAIHRNWSAEGVSLLTQLLYMVVFITRYLDLFWVPPGWNLWNFVLKLFYLISSAYIVFLMVRVFPRTREKEYGWKLALWSLAGCLVTAPLIDLVIRGWQKTTFTEVLWTFSVELESVCVLPQLLLLRQTSVPTVLNSFYLVTLGSYRFYYLLNWIVRGFREGWFDPIVVIFGIVQTALYVDFLWVYFSRQRVKLRGGGIVDSDDLRKSFLVKRFIGHVRHSSEDGDEDDIVDADAAALAGQENGTIRREAPRSGRSWGARGISVSADDTLPSADRPGAETQAGYADSAAEHDAQIVDPAHFEDEEEDPDAPLEQAPAKASAEPVESSAEEWQDNTGTK